MVLLNTLRVLFILLSFIIGMVIQRPLEAPVWFPFTMALFSAAIVLLEIIFRTQYRQRMVAVFFGLIVGFLVTAVLVGLLKAITPSQLYSETILHYLPFITLLICYLSVTIVAQTKDELRLIIPYVDFQNRGGQGSALVVDTSALIDGRLVDLAHIGIMPNRMIIPRFVLQELQTLSDSSDSIKRTRGRRGLDNASHLQAAPEIVVTIDDMDFPGIPEVDERLINLAKRRSAVLITTDSNLTKVARLHEIMVLNVHEIAQLVKPPVVPGEIMQLRVAKKGDQREQGVAFLEDGTMVVIENARDYVGTDVMCEIEKVSQSSVGRIVFGRKMIEGEKGRFSTAQSSSARDSGVNARGSQRTPGTRISHRSGAQSSNRSRRSDRVGKPVDAGNKRSSSQRNTPPSISAEELKQAEVQENVEKQSRVTNSDTTTHNA